MSGEQEVPGVNSPARGTCKILLNAAETQITVNCTFSGLLTNLQAGHIHGNAPVGTNAPVLFGFTGLPSGTSGTIGPLNFNVTAQQVAAMRAHLYYANLHTTGFPGGEIRGQVKQVHTAMDIDGDGRSDPFTYRLSNQTFWYLKSLNGGIATYTLGTPSDFPTKTGDVDGDGREDPTLVRSGPGDSNIWSIFQTATNSVRVFQWGGGPDRNATTDHDGDGTMDIAIFRPPTGQWWIIDSSTATVRVETWGSEFDLPSVGDYDGDGKADLTVVRGENFQWVWYIRQSSTMSMRREVFGTVNDSFFLFEPFDIDGDGKRDLCVIRNESSQYVWYVLQSSNRQVVQIRWGSPGTLDTILVGDYDGDGKTDPVARRNIGGSLVWHVLRSSDGQIQYIYWGISGDLIVDEGGDRSMIGYGG